MKKTMKSKCLYCGKQIIFIKPKDKSGCFYVNELKQTLGNWSMHRDTCSSGKFSDMQYMRMLIERSKNKKLKKEIAKKNQLSLFDISN